MANILQHGTAPFWGVNATITGLYLESLDYTATATTAQLKDQQGAVVGVTAYDLETTFNASGAALLPSSGSQDSRAVPTALANQVGKAVSLLTLPSGLDAGCAVGPHGTSTTAIVTSMGWTEGNEANTTANLSGNVYHW